KNDSLTSTNIIVQYNNSSKDNIRRNINYSKLSCDSLLTLLIRSSSLDSNLKVFDIEPIEFDEGILKLQCGDTNEFGDWKPIAWLELDTINSQLRQVTHVLTYKGQDSIIILHYDTTIYRTIIKKCFKH
ncbi:MAG: hypothetical protein ACRDE2_12670, partial [Chitinophagaceae bacterium]